MTDLLPCPLCGGDAEYMHVTGVRAPWSRVQADALAVTVVCTECGCTIPSSMSEGRATESWNRRADS